ncbi:hypothetical protein JZM24_02850 [Candidatus Sodalis endolongispinus]|uniref:Uncharacterized protein n=1 Tax=Candidatus Sodalis endolongispinus TaxID=2812662 RepID=A0ABS5Y9F0_9GAMM|nr:hypothetical protein [Candidatus Sodalis endolongispinus]MBT9431357.1 hypothetical protein [Candidatus Sodalis endolongispinus]
MTATTQDRNTPYRDGELTPYPVAAKENIPAGVIVCLKDGYAVNGQGGETLVYAGRADEAIDNRQGGNGDQHILVRRHKAFLWENDGSVKQAHVGKPAYVVDNQTVSASDCGTPAQEGKPGKPASRSAAGTIIMLDAAGVWVE